MQKQKVPFIVQLASWMSFHGGGNKMPTSQKREALKGAAHEFEGHKFQFPWLRKVIQRTESSSNYIF